MSVSEQPTAITAKERVALLKIRNKSCVPSFLWQRLEAVGSDGRTEWLLFRRGVYLRIHEELVMLQKSDWFQEIEIKPHPRKPNMLFVRILGVSPRFKSINRFGLHHENLPVAVP